MLSDTDWQSAKYKKKQSWGEDSNFLTRCRSTSHRFTSWLSQDCYTFLSQYNILIVKDGTEVLKREPTKPEVIYREMLKKYEHTTYGRQILWELDMAVDSDEDLYKFVMYAHEHKRRFHICYDKWEEEPDKSKIIFVGRLADDSGYMYLYK